MPATRRRASSATCTTFDEYLPLLMSAVDRAKARQSAGLLPVLRRRVQFSPTAEQTATIVERVKELPNYPSIAFTIALESQLGTQCRVLAAVGNELASEFRRRSGVLTIGAGPASSKSGLSDWVQQSIGSCQGKSLEQVRAVFISLLSFADRHYFSDLLFGFLRATLPQSPRKRAFDRGTIDRQLGLALGKFLQGKTIKKGQIRSTMAVVSAIEDALELERASRRKGETQLMESQHLTRELSDQVRRLEDSGREKAQRIQHQDAELEKLRETAKRGEERATELDKHWKVVVTQEKAGERHKIRQQLEHELQEATLAISRPVPNAEMAAQRLDRALKILRET